MALEDTRIEHMARLAMALEDTRIEHMARLAAFLHCGVNDLT